MSDFNPYAPPQVDLSASAPRKKKRQRAARSAIDDALARLNEHLSNPGNVEADRKAAGRRLRNVTIIFCVLAALFVAPLALIPSRDALFPVFVGLMVVFGILAGVLVAVDLSFGSRFTAVSPDVTLKNYFKAMGMGRHGYAWACLCPTARGQTVNAPVLGALTAASGTFSIQTPELMKGYIRTFIGQSGGTMRTLQVKRAAIVTQEDDVATVEVTVACQAWPQWVNIVAAIGFVLFRPLVLIGIILFFVVRKRADLVLPKTLIRGQDGLWYVYQGDIVEGEAEAA